MLIKSKKDAEMYEIMVKSIEEYNNKVMNKKDRLPKLRKVRYKKFMKKN